MGYEMSTKILKTPGIILAVAVIPALVYAQARVRVTGTDSTGAVIDVAAECVNGVCYLKTKSLCITDPTSQVIITSPDGGMPVVSIANTPTVIPQLQAPDGGAVAQRGTANGSAYIAPEPVSASAGGVVSLPAGSPQFDGGIDAGPRPATQIPPGDVGIVPSTITIQNLDMQPIWCGPTAATSNANGIQVDGSPDGVKAGGIYTAPISSTVQVFCSSAAGQTAPQSVRWTEVQ